MHCSKEQLIEALRETFGHDGFRPGQEEIVDSVLSKVPTIAIMPTGSGKSLCYQLPAVVLEGATIVVSPLIALIKDQVQKLKAHGINAASLTSVDSAEDRRLAMDALADGSLKLLYVAPERFKVDRFMKRVLESNIELFVIDEAHCISQWGHDFRPDYAKLGEVVQTINPDRLVALTATATPEVRQDIIRSLGLAEHRAIVTGFDRENLTLSVEETNKGKAKLKATTGALKRWMKDGGSAIVYVATRKQSEKLSENLAEAGFLAEPYHAGLLPDVRARVQQTFQSEPSRVVVATSAFGMGVDKKDVRVVVHYQIPSSPEAYYQEVGRAGRDGLPAGGVLIYDQSDLRFAYMRHESSCPTYGAVKRAFAMVKRRASDPALDQASEQSFERTVDALSVQLGSPSRACVVALEEAGDISFSRSAGLCVNTNQLSVDEDWLEHRARLDRTRLDAMIGYVMRAPCRRRYLVDYFGDARRPERCGLCDRCLTPPPQKLEGKALEHALITLSCIARMRGRFGKQRVVEVLLGSKARAMYETRLDQLSTYGLLSAWSKSEVQALIDSLIRADLARVTPTEYPTLMLTQTGVDALKSSEREIMLDLRLPRWEPKPRSMPFVKELTVVPQAAQAPEALDYDETLFEHLRIWRRDLANSLDVPPYVVAHDKLLKAVAMTAPDTLEALEALPGMGKKKLEKYGEAILKIIAGVTLEDTEVPTQPTPPTSIPAPPAKLNVVEAELPDVW